MSIGRSGRIVIEVDPDLKRLLYAALARDGMTLKDWFLNNTEMYLNEATQIRLPLEDSNKKTKHNIKES